MAAEIIIILYVAILALLGSVFLLDFMWSRKSEKIREEYHKMQAHKPTR